MMDDTEDVVLTVSECARILKISRGSAYQAILKNELPYISIGRRYLVPRKALERLLEGVDGSNKTCTEDFPRVKE